MMLKGVLNQTVWRWNSKLIGRVFKIHYSFLVSWHLITIIEVVSSNTPIYRSEPELNRDDDPLEYWKKNQARFPNLIILVKKYLCIQASSTEAERSFSALANLLTKRRLRMSGDNVNKAWLQKKQHKNRGKGSEKGSNLECRGNIVINFTVLLYWSRSQAIVPPRQVQMLDGTPDYCHLNE